MQSPGPEREDAVPLADADIAMRIARAAKRGRGTDRTPTLEQLLSAFGESEPTEAARHRVRAALALAGVDARPSVTDVQPGERILLTVPGGAGRRSGGRALGGLLALAAVLVLAAVAGTLAGQGDDDRASDLPPDTASTTVAPASSTTDATQTDETTDTTATEPQDQPAKKRRRKRAAPAAPRTVTVRVTASERPTFLCAEDGDGRQLYNGTLSGTETFKERVVRLNIGLSSTEVTVDGRAVPVGGSPAGLEISRGGGTKPLALGKRPCA